MQAYRIFESKGMDKLVKEVAQKLKLINSPKRGGDMRIKEEEKALINEEGKSKDSGSPSPDKPSTSGVPSAEVKQKKIAAKGKKGKKKASVKQIA